MTQEEKGKAYEERLNTARHIYADPSVKEEDKYYIEVIFPELKESEDERIRKWLIAQLKIKIGDNATLNNMIYKAIAWLGKQGEQKPTLRERYKNIAESEWFKKTHDVMSVSNDEEPKWTDDDKIEPKFKVGDWVVYDHRPYQIVELPKEGYINLGLRGNGKIEFAPSTYCRHWTIQDAKDSDVLVASDGSIFIYKCQRDNGVVHYIAVTPCNDLVINENDYSWESKNACHPATKEQRDLLFQRMHKAGYKWNAEKKELKKIHVIDEGKAEMDYCFTKMMNGEKVSSAWSEEDENKINTIIQIYHPSKKIMDWLKSLKNRYAWKPSEEQMKALHDLNLTGNLSYAGQGQTLIELYNDLKKL